MKFKSPLRSRALAAWIALLAAGYLAAPIPLAAQNARKTTDARQVKRYSIEQFMNTVRVTGASFSPDERSLLFSSNKTGIFNVYSVPVTGGEARRLTDSTKESTFAVTYLPDGRFLYSYDRGGNENTHLYVREADGTERDLTPGEKTKANFSGWAHDRKSFFVSTNARDPKFFDLYEVSLPEFKQTLVFQNEAGYQLADISNDKRYVAFTKPGATTIDGDIYLYDTATKQLKHLTPHAGEISFAAQDFATVFSSYTP